MEKQFRPSAPTSGHDSSQSKQAPRALQHPASPVTVQALAGLVGESPRVVAQRDLQRWVNTSPRMTAQRHTMQPRQTAGTSETTALATSRPNRTGLPDQLKSGVESLSGFSLDQVQVHFNSSQPAKLQAAAFAEGEHIHVAPGEERHLAHEAWHVVQQKQGRVRPTSSMAGRPVNDDVALEREADRMGGRAMQSRPRRMQLKTRGPARRPVVQGVLQFGKQLFDAKAKKEQNKSRFDKALTEINEHVKQANAKIVKIRDIKATLATDSTTTPMNPAVHIANMPVTATVNMSLKEARLAAFSMLVKTHINSLQENNASPEVQTALVKSTINAVEAIYVSGNSGSANKKIGADGAELSTFYVETLRKHSIFRRAAALERSLSKSYSRKKGVLITAKLKKAAGIKPGATKAEIEEKILAYLASASKRDPDRRLAKSARAFSREHGKKVLRVPPNSEGIHAESAILSYMRKAKTVITEIGGTKVACLACMAYFNYTGKADLLGKNTGYAWISESSKTQLKSLLAEIDSTESFLINLVKMLQSRLAQLKRYSGRGGEKKHADADMEDDVDDTDSEDEAAYDQLKTNANLIKIVNAVLANP